MQTSVYLRAQPTCLQWETGRCSSDKNPRVLLGPNLKKPGRAICNRESVMASLGSRGRSAVPLLFGLNLGSPTGRCRAASGQGERSSGNEQLCIRCTSVWGLRVRLVQALAGMAGAQGERPGEPRAGL